MCSNGDVDRRRAEGTADIFEICLEPAAAMDKFWPGTTGGRGKRSSSIERAVFLRMETSLWSLGGS